MNASAWLTGAYIGRVLSSAFGKGRYPDKPIPLNGDSESADGKTNADVMRARFEAMAHGVNNTLKRRGGEHIEHGD